MLEPSGGPSAPAPQPPAEAQRRVRRESFRQEQGGLAEGKGKAYFAREVRLTKKHEEILAQRLLLLKEMENDHDGQKTEEKKAFYMKAAQLASKRNQSLLKHSCCRGGYHHLLFSSPGFAAGVACSPHRPMDPGTRRCDPCSHSTPPIHPHGHLLFRVLILLFWNSRRKMTPWVTRSKEIVSRDSDEKAFVKALTCHVLLTPGLLSLFLLSTAIAALVQAFRTSHPGCFLFLCLFQDIRTLEEKLEKKVHLRSHPEMVTLQTLYWASVEEEAPKWEQFLLGGAQYPVGVRYQNPAGNDVTDATER
ncbi:uncharacterized protein C3orf14 homolog isoform X2 [Vombatus ursinus]|uniref:uncharacterized protein C3orf14 homolog isoform X2 n=1 Tax=Vombatus ursinus TaxID=29139 RepID=UPI000FFD00DC|nr:uncharacterized protein C3orf14 homolog isoform X2 [Vombatus ursinus]